MSILNIVPFEQIDAITSASSVPRAGAAGAGAERGDDRTFDKNLIDAIAAGFRDFSSGKFNLCPIQTMGAPPMAPFVPDAPDYSAQVCVKSGYITGDDYFVLMVAGGGAPMPENTGVMLCCALYFHMLTG